MSAIQKKRRSQIRLRLIFLLSISLPPSQNGQVMGETNG